MEQEPRKRVHNNSESQGEPLMKRPHQTALTLPTHTFSQKLGDIAAPDVNHLLNFALLQQFPLVASTSTAPPPAPPPPPPRRQTIGASTMSPQMLQAIQRLPRGLQTIPFPQQNFFLLPQQQSDTVPAATVQPLYVPPSFQNSTDPIFQKFIESVCQNIRELIEEKKRSEE